MAVAYKDYYKLLGVGRNAKSEDPAVRRTTLDELAASLDVAHAVSLFDFLQNCADKTLVMVMHDCNLAARYATRLVGLKAGRLVFDGPTTAMFTRENLHALYDMPFSVFPHPALGIPQALPDLLPVSDNLAACSASCGSAGSHPH